MIFNDEILLCVATRAFLFRVFVTRPVVLAVSLKLLALSTVTER